MFDLEKSFTALVNDCFLDYAASTQTGFTRALNEYFESLTDDKIVAIYGIGRLTKSIVSLLDDEIKSRISYYADILAESDGIIFENKTVLTPEQLFTVKPDLVILCSIDQVLSMRKTLLDSGFSSLNLIEIDTQLGMNSLQKGFVGYTRMSIALMSYAALEYCTDDDISADVIKELVYAYIEIRDILNAQRYAELYVQKGYPGCERFKKFLLELRILLDEMRQALQRRRSPLFVSYLFDGLSEKLIEFTTYIKKRKSKSLVFDRAFTQYAYTTSSLQCMFTGKDLIDEGSCEITPFTLENSILLKTFQEYGYTFKPIIAINKQLFNSTDCESVYLRTISLQLWHLLCEICAIDEKQAFYIHMMETHPPYHNGVTSCAGILSQSDFDRNLKTELMNLRILEVMKALRYVDEQWCFYDDFLPEQAISVFMSDHGNMFNYYIGADSKHYSEFDQVAQNTRITLFASSANIQSSIVDELFSIKDFYKLFLYLTGDLTIDSVTCEYCKLQILPYYDIALLERMTPNLPLPKRGIITKDGIYLRDYNGNEIYYPNKLENHIANPAYADEISKCRELCITDLQGLFDRDKFATAKKYYLQVGLIKG